MLSCQPFPSQQFYLYICVSTDTQLCVLGDYHIPPELAQPSACCLYLAGLQLRPYCWREVWFVSEDKTRWEAAGQAFVSASVKIR